MVDCAYGEACCTLLLVRAFIIINLAFYVWQDQTLLVQLIPIQKHVSTNTGVSNTFWEGMQQVVTQIQTPTHLQLAEICRERFQLVVIQIKIPGAHQSAE